MREPDCQFVTRCEGFETTYCERAGAMRWRGFPVCPEHLDELEGPNGPLILVDKKHGVTKSYPTTVGRLRVRI